MIGFMGWEPDEYATAWDELLAFIAFFEDPESDIDLIQAVEEAYEVVM
ncbi:hypothetical protein KGG99_gp37 [Streptomyces phage Werner]|uniref:Uncharacterized protein n=1 Tax=Streptomyces phage Werner TaxID=2801898 RepID=A0A7U0GCV3_9CAUD|nr:hypothetical protein KGG99_gp37 [Streptomyces phage Werner]QQV92858.1 hypothetical protein SEA_WERNER_37 [Streptomyces phage Werner]